MIKIEPHDGQTKGIKEGEGVKLNDIRFEIKRTDTERTATVVANLRLRIANLRVSGGNNHIQINPFELDVGFEMGNRETANRGALEARGPSSNGVNAWLAKVASAKSSPGIVDTLALKFMSNYKRMGLSARCLLTVADGSIQVSRVGGQISVMNLDAGLEASVSRTETVMQGNFLGKFEEGAELTIGDSAVKF